MNKKRTLYKKKLKKPVKAEGMVFLIYGNGHVTEVHKDKNRYYLVSNGIRMEEYESELGKLLYDLLSQKQILVYVTSTRVYLEVVKNGVTLRAFSSGLTYGEQIGSILYHINYLLGVYFNKKGTHRKHKTHGETCKNCRYCGKVILDGELEGYRCKRDKLEIHPFNKCSDYERGKSWHKDKKEQKQK